MAHDKNSDIKTAVYLPQAREASTVTKLGMFFHDMMNQFVKGNGTPAAGQVIERLEKYNRPYVKKLKEGISPENCKHLKGGMAANGQGNEFGYVDHSVYQHKLPTGEYFIKCTICGKEWRKGDPDWNDALKMMADSSNTPSASEVAPDSKPWQVQVSIYPPKFEYFTTEREAKAWIDEQKRKAKHEVVYQDKL